jgi:hypothetical protein
MIEAFLQHFTESLSKRAAGELFDEYLRKRLIDIWWDDHRGYVVTMRPCAATGNPSDPDELSVPAAAVICGRSQQTIRNWAPHIGHFDPIVHRFIISKTKLAAYLRKRFGRVPSELESWFASRRMSARSAERTLSKRRRPG